MRKSTLQLAEERLRIDGRAFSRYSRPQCIRPLDQLDRRYPATHILLGPVQTIKTMTSVIWVCTQQMRRPTRVGWYSVNDQVGVKFIDEKLQPFFDENKWLLGQQPLDRGKNKKAYKSMLFGFVACFNANNINDRNQKTLETIVCEEPWLFEPGHLNEIKKRADNYLSSYRIVLPTSGPTVGDAVDEAIRDGEYWAWHVPCDHCNRLIDLDFMRKSKVDLAPGQTRGDVVAEGERERFQPWGGMLFDTKAAAREDGTINWSAFYETVKFQCPECGGELHDDETQRQKRNMAALEYDAIGTEYEGRFDRGYLLMNPGNCRRDIVTHYSSVLSYKPWEVVAERYVKAVHARNQGDLEQYEDWWRKEYSKSWSIRVAHKSENVAGMIGDYKLGEKWDGAEHYFMTIDWQQDHWWWLVRGWGRNAAGQPETRLVDLGRAIVQDQLIEKAQEWGVQDFGDIMQHGRKNLYQLAQPCGAWFDERYQPKQVRRLAAQWRWGCLSGEDVGEMSDASGIKRVFSPVRPVDAFETMPADGASRYVPRVVMANTPARNLLATVRGISEPHRLWTVARDTPGVYYDHMKAWHRELRKRKADNTEHWAWVKDKQRDDYFWCEKAQIVVASMYNLIGAYHETSASAEVVAGGVKPREPAPADGRQMNLTE